MKKLSEPKTLAFIGLMAALTYVCNWLRFPISLGIGSTAIHLGNAMCVLSGLLLGGIGGGLSAGIGGFVFDLTYPGYASGAVFTLVFKFALAFVCGVIVYFKGNKAENKALNIIGATAGSLTYVVLYLGKGFVTNIFFLNISLNSAVALAGAKALASTVNAIIAVAIALPLFYAIRAALKRTGVSFFN